MSQPKRPARIGFLLAQLGADAANLFAEQVRPLGVTRSEAGVIRVIGHAPGITQRQLADKLGTLQSRVVTLIDDLESKGLASRTRSTTDRRTQELGLTTAGHQLLAELRQAAQTQEQAIVCGLTEQQQSDLYELLTTLRQLRGLDPDIHQGHSAHTVS